MYKSNVLLKNQDDLLRYKINRYLDWYKEMPMGERVGWKGHWVKERIQWLSEAFAAAQMDKVKAA